MTTTLVAGLDLGSTGVKILVADDAGAEVLIRQLPTPWRPGPGGTTTMDAVDLLATVHELLALAATGLADLRGPDARIEAIAVSGMGESGIVLGADGSPIAPAIAWFDPRGAEQVEALPASIRTEFAGRTGLPLGVQVSVIKLLHLRDAGLDLRGAQWLNLPEFVVASLGGRAAAEYSLSSRTGLLDQDTGAPWPELMAHLGVTDDFLPPFVDAGTPLGEATAPGLPASVAGARLSVAGHDHLVSAVSTGEFADDRYHVSMGTAEVLLRVLDEPLPFDARDRLAEYFINCVRHVVPGKWVLVAGVKTGLLMRRTLHLVGVTDRDGRDALDAAVMEQPVEGVLQPGDVDVAGARNDDGVLRLVMHADGAGPADLFSAVLRHGNDEIAVLIDAMDRDVPPATSALLTGGWASMRSVRRAREQVLPNVRVSDRSQDTAYGATRFAARLLTPILSHPLTKENLP
ncbi:FGGY-family carbohydrate kinase [Herbiconiux ginsengi]|uniref:Sugar (Pentulose or hexulose) kinase n=1 Tax=Herbiconiux ginsengi TaxID=381665 RepID=A0A1H3QTI2_9MICO|nr:FGGY family carbohydrate kinase [Herbiconiux ginsengi]SDZ16716.1 Sugar (pentulose or hexulose) kinase [Herbiconiux ginsengi]